ncbi:asialoglycoprotein receptor 1-like isoform X3 [Cygnus olor]|nr:asialoglycoprotein receptor 1-like isoform X3 [Cygnus olor]
MEACLIPSLLRYVCRWNGSAGHGGCKLCPQSWQLSGDQCYQVPKSSGTWMQGKKDCESRGSHLAMLRNTADMEHLNEGIQQGSKEKLSVWIGLKASNNTWKWVDNSSFDATTQRGFNALGVLQWRKEPDVSASTAMCTRIWASPQQEATWSPVRQAGGEAPIAPSPKRKRSCFWVLTVLVCRFSSLRNVENGCATFKDKRLEDDCCGCNHKWVCQKEPFHLLSKTAGDGELCGARPEKPSLQDACC